MATSELSAVGGADEAKQSAGPSGALGRSGARRTWGLIGHYAVLTILAALVLAPLLLTVRQALTPPFQWVNRGRPPYPVLIDWKDRTWFTGGAVSLISRTLVVGLVLAWLQKVAAGVGWRDRSLRSPARLVAVGGGTVALAVATGPAFQSFYDADGNTLALVVLAMALLTVTQVWGFASGNRSVVVGVIQAVSVGFGVTAIALIFVGPVVWTLSWDRYDLGGAMGRSLAMTVIITVAQVATSIMAAYAFVFLRFPFKRILFGLFMATLLLPLEVTLVGNIATIRQLDWTNTLQALVLPFGASALGTFLIRQGFRGLPPEIRDATRLDGYGHVSFLTKFAVPLTRPVIASFTVISALQAWNQYLWPRAVITRNELNTLQIQLRSVSAGQVAAANQAIAAALVATVPVAILLIAFQRQIIRGLTAGAVK